MFYNDMEKGCNQLIGKRRERDRGDAKSLCESGLFTPIRGPLLSRRGQGRASIRYVLYLVSSYIAVIKSGSNSCGFVYIEVYSVRYSGIL
jgi:hypothetical protein